MSYTLQSGLDDLSAVLNENTTVTTTARKTHYNEALQEFCRYKKWPFLIKDSTDLTEADVANYPLPSDIREPGGMIEVTIGSTEYLPAKFNDRLSLDENGYYYYLNIAYDDRDINFVPTPDSAGDTITMRHYFVPTRLTTLTDSFPLPDFVRRPIAVLAAEFVSRAKRQHATANNFRELYNQARDEVVVMQAEQPTKLPRRFGFYSKIYSFRKNA